MSAADSADERSPGEIWDKATSIEHHTFTASARAYRRDGEDAPDSDDVGTVSLTPYIGQNEGDWFVVSLKAFAKLPGHVIEFEEAARIDLTEDLHLEFDELQEFGAEYVLPFLLPYVESGFTRMCREVDERPPKFPLIVMKGQFLQPGAFAGEASVSERAEAADTETRGRRRQSR